MTRSMTHDDVRARLSALMDGVLDAREAKEVEVHLAACATCAAGLAEMQSMVAILRDVEPVEAPDGFAASVRARLEHLGTTSGAPIGSRLLARLSLGRQSWKPIAAAVAVAAVGIFVLSGIRDRTDQGAISVATSNDQQLQSERAGSAQSGPQARMAAPAAPVPPNESQRPAGVRGQAAPGSAPRPNSQQYLVRTGKVAVEVDVFDDASRRVEAIAETSDGTVASSSVADAGSEPRGTFILRVPAARFADATRQIEALGRIRTREYRARDVGEEYVDIDARLRNLHRQESRLLSFMERASRIPDLVTIETEVSRVRGAIEQLTGRQRYLLNRINLATIEVEITQKPKKKSGGCWGMSCYTSDRCPQRAPKSFCSTPTA